MECHKFRYKQIPVSKKRQKKQRKQELKAKKPTGCHVQAKELENASVDIKREKFKVDRDNDNIVTQFTDKTTLRRKRKQYGARRQDVSYIQARHDLEASYKDALHQLKRSEEHHVNKQNDKFIKDVSEKCVVEMGDALELSNRIREICGVPSSKMIDTKLEAVLKHPHVFDNTLLGDGQGPASEYMQSNNIKNKVKVPESYVGEDEQISRRNLRKNIWKFRRQKFLYLDMLKLHESWKELASKVFGKLTAPLNTGDGDISDENHSSSCYLTAEQDYCLSKLDFHGCLITIRKAQNLCLVGLSGIILEILSNKLSIISEDNRTRSIVKNGVVLAFNIGNIEISMEAKKIR